MVRYANVPRLVRAKFTWFVMGPVSSDLMTANGGFALNTITRPVSLSVNHTWLPSGVAATSGQKGLSCFTLPTMVWLATSMTTVCGLNEEHTKPYLPSGEKICMPGPGGVVMRVLGS